VPHQETTTQRRSHPSHSQRKPSERCKILKGGPSARHSLTANDRSLLNMCISFILTNNRMYIDSVRIELDRLEGSLKLRDLFDDDTKNRFYAI